MSKGSKDYFYSKFFKRKYRTLNGLKLGMSHPILDLYSYTTSLSDNISFSAFFNHSTISLLATTKDLAVTGLITYGSLFAFNYILPMYSTANFFISLFIFLPALVALGCAAIIGGIASFDTFGMFCWALTCSMLTGAIGVTTLANNAVDFFAPTPA